MTFYALHIPTINEDRIELLRTAARKLKMDFKILDPFSTDFSKPSPLKKGDIIYKVSRGKILQVLENFLIQPGVATFHQDPFSKKNNIFTLAKNKIPLPKTILCTIRKRKKLVEYVKTLSGFPIVLKVIGGTRGLGVMKIDSYSALFSIVDFLLSQNKIFTLNQYIRVKTSARLIVLGDKVIASYEYIAKDHDFRTNAAEKPQVKIKQYSMELQKIAIQATHALGWEFGGVDILIQNGKPYVTEVNFPCNFVRAQELLKKDIALEMMKYLKQKAEILVGQPGIEPGTIAP